MEENKNDNYIIEVKNLTKTFKDFTAVDNVSFRVRRGEIFAFLGPNGAGKTTTIKMLTTLLKPSRGKIVINGMDPVKQHEKVRHSFGIVFQDQSLDEELTAWENMEYHGVLYGIKKKERREKIVKLLNFIGLWDKRKELVKNYSGGMKRRLEIARGFLHEPQILFMDEPTLGLDPQTRNHIWEHVKKLNREIGTTVFFSTHYMDEVERAASHVTIIDHGQIVANGSPDELKEKTEKNNLEDVFLALTGKDIRKEEKENSSKRFMMMRKKQRRN